MEIATNRWTLRGAITWSGLAVSAAILTGMVVYPPVVDSARSENETRPVAAEDFCAPGEEESVSRVAYPTGNGDPDALTPHKAAELNRRLEQSVIRHRAPDAQNPQIVQVVFHVISHPDGTGGIDTQVIDKQIEVLDEAFSGHYGGVDTGFRFELEEITHTANDRWFGDFFANEKTIKRELHQGDAQTLNIYSIDMGEGLLGRSSFPQDYQDNPQGDGIIIDYRTVPGGGYTNFNVGHTVTHEAGHWLGLFHTFQNGCADPGDYVSDTPYEREQAIGCPVGRDSCPHHTGRDPVRNYMNYSYDRCLNEFTRGQADRMAKTWAAFRENSEK